MTEDEMVNHQMAKLLSKSAHPQPSPDPTSTTFRIEWPPGAFDEPDTDQVDSESSRNLLSPEHAVQQVGGIQGALGKLGKAVGIDGRGRAEKRAQAAVDARAKSREEKRRQIEMSGLDGAEK
jgi:hypothetical protein